MRVLVTGGTGFTGSHLCRRLITEGYAVRALVRDFRRAAELHRIGVGLIKGDLRDRTSLKGALKNIDIVYNIAAAYRQENVSRKELWDTNVQGTKNLLEAAIDSWVRRFIHCSTVAVHGNVENPPADENSPYAPGDNYQKSRVEGESLVKDYMNQNKIPIVIVRPCGIYGPGDVRFLKLIKAIKKGFFIMIGSGEVYYHMIYIDDLIDGILLCGIKKEAVGNTYILGGNEVVNLNQLVDVIAEVLGARKPRLHVPFTPIYCASLLCEWICKPLGVNPPLYRRRVDFFSKNRAFDISKAKRELGFRPKIDLETGIGLTIKWYQQNGYL